jgi:hypothetical protein
MAVNRGKFTAGKSGNPGGSSARQRAQQLSVSQQAKLTLAGVTEGGRTRLEWLLNHLWERAQQGDVQAARILLEFANRRDDDNEDSYV